MAGAVDATCQLASGSFVVVTSEQLTYGLARGGAMSAARAPLSANRNDELIRTDRRPTVFDPRSPCEFSTCSQSPARLARGATITSASGC
jgi:hypothetical protein